MNYTGFGMITATDWINYKTNEKNTPLFQSSFIWNDQGEARAQYLVIKPFYRGIICWSQGFSLGTYLVRSLLRSFRATSRLMRLFSLGGMSSKGFAESRRELSSQCSILARTCSVIVMSRHGRKSSGYYLFDNGDPVPHTQKVSQWLQSRSCLTYC
jgi:hypothetical protein